MTTALCIVLIAVLIFIFVMFLVFKMDLSSGGEIAFKISPTGINFNIKKDSKNEKNNGSHPSSFEDKK